MQRDKRGRFVKKAQDGTTLTLKGKKYKVNLEEARKAHEVYLNTLLGKFTEEDEVFEKWLPLHGTKYLTEILESPVSLNTPTIGFNTNLGSTPFQPKPLTTPELPKTQTYLELLIHDLGVQNGVYDKTKYDSNSDGSFTTDGKLLSIFNITRNKDLYELDEVDPGKIISKDVKSAGMTLSEDKKVNNSVSINKPIDKSRLADFLELTRAGIGASVNNKVAKRALEAEKPFLQDVSESHRAIYGDYRAQVQGEKAAAQLRNIASKPMTSDGALQLQMMMDALIKGQQYIDLGNAQDEAMIKQTREVAWQQEKENLQQRQAVAMLNRQAMLMSEKNKANILNMRDSANFSQVVSPLLAGKEQRLRNEAAKLEHYQDYYDDALIQSEVYNTYRDGLTATLKALADVYLTSGVEGLTKYIKDNNLTENDWLQTLKVLNNEVLRRKAALKGVYINSPSNISLNNTNYFDPSNSLFNKKGGTIYKARLTKRTRDNDRGAKSIESSKKIAARFLEKAIDSLYNYNDVELIAKPKKKRRKYLAGGGLPFVGFTPVFATSEAGAPKITEEAKSKKKGEDLTSKDILELLKDIDGLPSDIDAIQATLSDFIIADKMDPLGLASSSDIASRYVSLIGRIKKAKANRDWYDKAYDKLRNDGALNEYAVDSTGHFIGVNQEGDFERFSAKQVANRELGNYRLLTNSNLLDIRANNLNAAFNSNLIMEAANGVSMEQITEHISKTIQGLGSDKTQTLVFGDQSKEVLAGLRQLQQAAQEVGQDLSISDLYEASVFNENQAKQAQMALSYLYLTLPTNMKALLFAKAGSQEGALGLINTLVNSKLSSTNKLEFSPKNKKGTTSSSKTSSKTVFDLDPVSMLQAGYGQLKTITIQTKAGSNRGLQVDTIQMPIVKKSGESIGANTTLTDVSESMFAGYLDFGQASMGGVMLDATGFSKVVVDGTALYTAYLPVDMIEAQLGNIKPDIDMLGRYKEAQQRIKDEGITDKNKINDIYQEVNLPIMFTENGDVTTNYIKFGILNGNAISSAFREDATFADWLQETRDKNEILNVMDIINKGRGSNSVDFDSASLWDDISPLWNSHDSMYRGTIFIPVNTDYFTSTAATGKYPSTEEAMMIEAKLQAALRENAANKSYKNPGNQL